MNYVCVNRGCSKDQTDAICGYYKNSVLLLQFTIWPHLAFEEIVLVHCMKTMNKIMCIYIYMYTHYNYIYIKLYIWLYLCTWFLTAVFLLIKARN